MTENQIVAISTETESEEIGLETIVEELVTVAFGTADTITPYKIAAIINKAFEATDNEKRIPPQMMYNYDRNGMITKGKKSVKAYNKDEVTAYVNKYVGKHSK